MQQRADTKNKAKRLRAINIQEVLDKNLILLQILRIMNNLFTIKIILNLGALILVLPNVNAIRIFVTDCVCYTKQKMGRLLYFKIYFCIQPCHTSILRGKIYYKIFVDCFQICM